MAVHAETPMPLIRVQDTTARYLPTSMGEMLRLWGFLSFLLSVRDRRLHLISLRERNISRAYAKQTYLLLDGIRLDGQQQWFPWRALVFQVRTCQRWARTGSARWLRPRSSGWRGPVCTGRVRRASLLPSAAAPPIKNEIQRSINDGGKSQRTNTLLLYLQETSQVSVLYLRIYFSDDFWLFKPFICPTTF